MTAPDTTAIRNVRRYKLVHDYDYQSQMLVRPDGSWVKHDDYLALCDETERLRAENERLRDALNRVVAIHDLYMHDADTNADDMARRARSALDQEGKN